MAKAKKERSEGTRGSSPVLTAAEVNALPERVRRYIHDLETRCDPAGELQERASLREQRDALLVAKVADPPPPTSITMGPNGLEGRWWKNGFTTPVRVFGGAGRGTMRATPGVTFNDSVASSEVPREFLVEADLAIDVRGTRVLAVMRYGELGDVIVMLAALRYIRKVLPNLERVILLAHERFHPVLRCQDEIEIESARPFMKPGFLVVDFNAYFEQDHRFGAVHVSRVDRVLRSFGVDAPRG